MQQNNITLTFIKFTTKSISFSYVKNCTFVYKLTQNPMNVFCKICLPVKYAGTASIVGNGNKSGIQTTGILFFKRVTVFNNKLSEIIVSSCVVVFILQLPDKYIFL